MSHQLTCRNAVPDLRAHFNAFNALAETATITDGFNSPLTADDAGMQDQIREMGASLVNQLGVGNEDAYMSDGTVATAGSDDDQNVFFTDVFSRAASPAYPQTGCDDDIIFRKNNDDDMPPPPYATVSTRYSLLGSEIVQDDLRPVQNLVTDKKVDVYRPPALRCAPKPDVAFKDIPTIREILNGFDYAVRNTQRSINMITSLSEEDRCALAHLVDALCPHNAVAFRIDPVAAVISAWPKYMGIDYDVRFTNGRSARIRDIDAWRSPNGRIMIALFWGNKKRVMSVEDIEKLLLLPQYRGEGGFFLQAMKAELLKGTVIAPRAGRAVF